MKTKRVYLCEDSIEGIFTSIYDAWNSRYGHDNIRIELQPDDSGYNMELFSEYINVVVDNEKTYKVAKAIREKISEDAYNMVCNVVCSNNKEKGDVIYRFLILGFAMGPQVVDHLSNDIVVKLFEMNRNVNYEAHHFLGFLRFSEGRSNILLSKIKPQNDILRLIAPHFSDRFEQENFIIYDETRKTAIFHRSGYHWIYTLADKFDIELFNELSEQEEKFQILWKTFFESIAIEERKNRNLQRNNLPIRFRSNMLEFKSKKEGNV